MARESDLGQGLGLGTSNGGVAQVVVECVRESARREGVGGWVGGGGGELVMSVQLGEVVGALEFWPRSRPRVWFRTYTCCTAGGRLVQ